MTFTLPRLSTLAAIVFTLVFAWPSAPSAQAGVGAAQQGQGGGRAGGRGAAAGQERDATQTAVVGTGLIIGQVITGDAGTPVRRARVNLSGTELRGQRSTVTDEEGRFVFTQIPAGRYTMTASKAGFVSIAYGAKTAGRAGTPIQLAEGQKLESKPIAMPKGGVVTGVVLDEYGEPAPGTSVRALRMVMRTGEKRLESAGTGTTDDRGQYRIYGLQPGQFIVTAQPRNTGLGGLQASVAGEIETALQQMQQQLGRGAGAGQAGMGGRGAGAGRGGQLGDLLQGLAGERGQQVIEQLQQQLDPDGQTSVGYAPVFFPGTTSPSAATTVDIVVGQERYGVDFQLQLVSTSNVAGVLSGVDGVVPAGAQVTLAPVDTLPGLPGGTQTVRANQTGAFSFRSVTPGQYRISARAQVRTPVAETAETEAPAAAGGRGGRGGGRGGAPAEILWAHADITVDGRDVSDVGLPLQKGMTISGRLAFDGTKLLAPTDFSRVRVMLTAVGTQDTEFGGLPNATVDASGRFTIIGVPPGRYSLRGTAPAGTGGPGVGAGGALAAGGSGTWILKSSVAGGRDTLDFPLEIGPNVNVTDAVLMFADRSTELTGLLQDAQGAATSDYSIIIFPTDSQYWVPQSRRIQSVRPGTDGRYTVRNLPPGDYALAAVTDVEPGEWFNPDFLKELIAASMRISLSDGDRKTQDIRLSVG